MVPNRQLQPECMGTMLQDSWWRQTAALTATLLEQVGRLRGAGRMYTAIVDCRWDGCRDCCC